jgi:hypothetical protein
MHETEECTTNKQSMSFFFLFNGEEDSISIHDRIARQS